MSVDRSWFRSMLFVFKDLRIEHNDKDRCVYFILRVGQYEEAFIVREHELTDPGTYQCTYVAVSYANQRLIALNAAAARLLS